MCSMHDTEHLMGERCSWPMTGEPDSRLCGHRARIAYTNTGGIHYERCTAHDSTRARMQAEGALFVERLASKEVGEAITAFFEKRKPSFRP